MIINRLLYLAAMLLWVLTLISIIIPILYWLLTGRKYVELAIEIDKLIE